jgi:hypothetical protein
MNGVVVVVVEVEVTRLRERAGEEKKSLVREEGGLFDMSTPMARQGVLGVANGLF